METLTQTAPRQLADLPAPGGLPVLGNLLALRPERLHAQLEAWHAELGSPYRLKLGPQQVYVSADPKTLGYEPNPGDLDVLKREREARLVNGFSRGSTVARHA